MKLTIQILGILLLVAVRAAGMPFSYSFRSLSVSDGLPDLVVNTCYKDRSGYMWFGTNVSLERFDGIRLKHYMIKGKDENLKRVYAVAELGEGGMWAGTDVGLLHLDKRTDALEAVEPALIDVPVYCLCAGGEQVLYIGTRKGLFIYQGGKMRHILIDKNVLSQWNEIRGINVGEDGCLWLATLKGVAVFQPDTDKVQAYAYRNPFYSLTRIGSVLYLGTMNEGIVTFDTRHADFGKLVDVGCSVISSLSTDGKDLLYVGTDGNGVHFVSVKQRKVVKSFRHETGNDASIRSNSVYSLLVDRDGLLWIGFYQLGIDYTLRTNGLFAAYRYPPHFDTRDMPVRTIAFHQSEKLVGSRDGLYFIDEARQVFKSFHDLRANMIIASCYFEGKYYIGTYGGGMYVFDPLTCRLSDFDAGEPDPFQTGHIFCIRPDAEGDLWIGTSAGLYRYRDGKQVAHYTGSNSKLPDGNIYEIFFDSTRKGWICTEKGLCIWDASSQSIRTDVFPEGFIHKEKVRVVYEDSSHNLYLLPEKGALFVSDLSMSHFSRYGHELLRGKTLMSVIEDVEGWLWLTTNNGIYRYDKKDRVVPYGLSDGILSPVFINCIPVKDESGKLWFGNSKGLIYLDMRRLKSKEEPPYKLVISGVQIDGEEAGAEVWSGDGIRLDKVQNNLTIQFSALTYTLLADMFYEYRLEGGKDESWKPLTGKSAVSFYNLSAGDYVFRVRSIGMPGSEIALPVHVDSMFGGWLWTGAVVCVLLIGGIAGYLVWRKRQSRLSAREETKGMESNIARSDSDKLVLQTILDGTLETYIPPMESLEEEPAKEKYKLHKVDPGECCQLEKKLEHLMQKEKPYKNPDLKIADLAKMTGYTSHTLSYFFNQYLKKNYYDYINEYRVEEFKRLIVDERYARYTLEALAEACGFSSRASFFRYFKKVSGITPNEYIRQLNR